MNNTELIVMLTYNDKTVKDAYKIFKECKNSNAQYWGFKEEGLPFEEMKLLYRYMKECGKTTVLEVVSYTEEECISGALMAVDCNVDILMGTIYSDTVNSICKKHNIKYMPFVGDIKQRPSILYGNIDSMINEANMYLEKGVYGFDLLGYRYINNPIELNTSFVKGVNAPVCIAGSIDSFNRIDEVTNINPWAFTIGSAFFDNKFNGTMEEQINKVYKYIKKSE